MTDSYDDEDGTTPPSGPDRDRVRREWGIDPQDTTRMADDPEWARKRLWRRRGGECIRGLGTTAPRRTTWNASSPSPPAMAIRRAKGIPTRRWCPARYLPGVRGRLWERRRLARLKRSRPDEDMAERVHRAAPAIGAGVPMGRMPS